jgi:hypothetical protein
MRIGIVRRAAHKVSGAGTLPGRLFRARLFQRKPLIEENSMDVYRLLGFLAPPAFFFGAILLSLGVFEESFRHAGVWGAALIGFGFAAMYVKLEEIVSVFRKG